MRKQLVFALATGMALSGVPLAAQEGSLGESTGTSNRPAASVPAASAVAMPGRMSCGTARLVSAPLGAGAGALGTFLLYELVTASTTASRTPPVGSDIQTPGSG